MAWLSIIARHEEPKCARSKRKARLCAAMRKAYVRVQGSNFRPVSSTTGRAVISSVKRVLGYWYSGEAEMYIIVQLKPGHFTKQRFRFYHDDEVLAFFGPPSGGELRYVYGPGERA